MGGLGGRKLGVLLVPSPPGYDARFSNKPQAYPLTNKHIYLRLRRANPLPHELADIVRVMVKSLGQVHRGEGTSEATARRRKQFRLRIIARDAEAD
jgi:hypothetical protein